MKLSAHLRFHAAPTRTLPQLKTISAPFADSQRHPRPKERDARRAKAHGEAPPPFAMRGVGLSRELSIVPPPPSATRLPPSWRGPWALRPRLAAGLPLSRRRSAIALVNYLTNLETSSL